MQYAIPIRVGPRDTLDLIELLNGGVRPLNQPGEDTFFITGKNVIPEIITRSELIKRFDEGKVERYMVMFYAVHS